MLFFAPDLYEEIDFKIEPDFLQQELFKEVIQGKKGKNFADQIVKVHLKNGENKWVLIHIEVQNEDHRVFSKRMFRYFYRIYDKFDKEVYAIAIITDDKKTSYPNSFHYHFFGTIIDYTYNVYKFHEHTIEQLEQSNNPFAAAIIAGKYASKYKKDLEQRLHFKIKLIKKVYKNFSSHKEHSRTYMTALLYFIDYLLQTPEEFDNEITEIFYKDGEKLMHAEQEELSPTFARMFKKIKEKARLETRISLAKNLMKENLQDEKIAELTELPLQEVVDLRKSLQD